MNSIAASISEWILIGSIATIFFLLRNHLFKKYEFFSYFWIVSAISTFSAGCFYLGKSSEKFFSKVDQCPYVQQSIVCFLGNYLSILPQLILIIFGLVFLFGVVESLEVRKKETDEQWSLFSKNTCLPNPVICNYFHSRKLVNFGWTYWTLIDIDSKATTDLGMWRIAEI